MQSYKSFYFMPSLYTSNPNFGWFAHPEHLDIQALNFREDTVNKGLGNFKCEKTGRVRTGI